MPQPERNGRNRPVDSLAWGHRWDASSWTNDVILDCGGDGHADGGRDDRPQLQADARRKRIRRLVVKAADSEKNEQADWFICLASASNGVTATQPCASRCANNWDEDRVTVFWDICWEVYGRAAATFVSNDSDHLLAHAKLNQEKSPTRWPVIFKQQWPRKSGLRRNEQKGIRYR